MGDGHDVVTTLPAQFHTFGVGYADFTTLIAHMCETEQVML
jgi:hypothetical protein